MVSFHIVDVSLQWGASGNTIKKWDDVPADTILSDLVSAELEKLSGEIRLVYKLKEVLFLHEELQRFMTSGDTILTFDLIRVHADKRNIVEFVPHLCLDGRTATKISQLGVVVTFPKDQERFSHALAAMHKEFDKKIGADFERQVLELMRQDLPGCVLRRKMKQFVKEGDDITAKRVINFVLEFDADGCISLRMDLGKFVVVESPDSNAVADAKTAVGLIHTMYAA